MINVNVVEPPIINIGVKQGQCVPVNLLTPIIHISEDYDFYEGDYVVDPKFESQKLLTNQKIMTDDVTVNAIEVHRTGNPYGTTVYIGGLING